MCAGNPVLRFHPALERKWYHKFNHIITLVGMSSGFFKWYVSDPFHYWTGTVGHVKFAVYQSDWINLWFWKVVWFLIHVVAPVYYTGFGRAMLCLTIYMVLGAYYLESIFIVNHIQDELVPPSAADSHWSNRQVQSTANWCSESWFWNWFSGGLNHQIEHHLFPSYSIYTYPVISKVVQQVTVHTTTAHHHCTPLHSTALLGSGSALLGSAPGWIVLELTPRSFDRRCVKSTASNIRITRRSPLRGGRWLRISKTSERTNSIDCKSRRQPHIKPK